MAGLLRLALCGGQRLSPHANCPSNEPLMKIFAAISGGLRPALRGDRSQTELNSHLQVVIPNGVGAVGLASCNDLT